MPPMRVPTTDVPRRSFGPRAWLIGAAIVLLLLVTSLRGIARFYTDYLWFDEVGFSDTWRSLLGAKVVPAVIFSVAFFVVLLVNLYIADRIAPRQRAMGTEDEIIEKYRTYVAPYSGRLRIGVAAFFALVMGGGVSAQWRHWVLFSNAVDFGVEDPQFHRDIGFYVFKLPFLQFAVGWAFAALLVVLIVTTVFHYVNGGIRLQSPFQRVTPQVKVHLSVILALMALTKTVQYYLARFELLFSHRGVVDGAGYTDVKAQLPALNFLMIISVAAAVLFIANIFRRGWVFPIIAVGLWGFISIVVGTIYPAYIQRIQVQPNEFSRERPYIERNIEATRAAFKLGSIDQRPFDYDTNIDVADVEENAKTLDNVRLWDPDELREVYRQTQEIAPYLAFNDVDLDRYTSGIDGAVPALGSVRELDSTRLPSRTWTNSHLVYTHGFGAVVAAGNTVDRDREPNYLVENIPPQGELKIDEPGVYFGESFGDFAVVGTKVSEVEPTGRESERRTRYDGSGGVQVSSFIRKAALALRFGSWDLFVSGQLTDESRVIYKRDIIDRVQTAAPFLRFDADPYPVVHDDRIFWIVDAYTTTDRYPYSQSIRPNALEGGSGLDAEFNYVRNSVKVTIDAYNGTMKFYVVDPDDPLAEAYSKAFPSLFTAGDEMPEELRAHWRYPEDLFRTQTEQYATYHMTDEEEFYNKADLWDITPQPAAPATTQSSGPATTTTTVAGNDGGRNNTLGSSGTPSVPLYQMLQLPGEKAQEFLLTRSFVPRGKGNQLTAFLAARNDGANYGKLVVYNAPRNSTTPSPARAASLIDSTDEISSLLTLLDQRGSTVLRGDVQLLPIKNSLIYVRPIWLKAESGPSFPRFRYVAMTLGDERAVLADSVDEGIQALFGNGPTVPDETPRENPEQPTEPEQPTQPERPSGSVEELLRQAQDEFDQANDALRRGDLGAYGEHVDAARDLINEALGQVNAPSSPTTSTTTAGTGTTTSSQPSTTTTVP
jgi:uncharacterized membrane protein (UPF0182 family)